MKPTMQEISGRMAFVEPSDKIVRQFETSHLRTRLYLGLGLSLAVVFSVSVAMLTVTPFTAGRGAAWAAEAEGMFIRLSGAAPPPRPEDVAAGLEDLTPEQAMLANSQIPISNLPSPLARPFFLSAASQVEASRALDCLTAAVYYEAGNESDDGQRAVAQVVVNRVRHPAYPKSVCGVVFEGSNRSTGCQFTFTCDGSLARTPPPAAWERARRNATAILNGAVSRVGYATHYHANYVVPYWAKRLVKVDVVGPHIFYRWEGGWGRPGAFSGQYAGLESMPAMLVRLSTAPTAEAAVPDAEAAAPEPVPAVAVVPEPAPARSEPAERTAAAAEAEQAAPAPAAAPPLAKAAPVEVKAAPATPAPPARKRRLATPSGW